MKFKKPKYLIKIIISFLFFSFYRMYDGSIQTGIFQFKLREIVFFSCFTLYLIFAWEFGEYIFRYSEKKFKKYDFRKKSISLLKIYIIYGFIVSLVFSFIYYLVDIIILKTPIHWKGIPYLHFEMNSGIYIFYSIVVTIKGFLYYYKHWQEEKIISEQLKRENIQSKYEALKNQVDPHFFFNSLSALASLNLKKEHELSAKYIEQLSKMYRYILDKDKKNLVTINEELIFLESYIFLIKVRHKKFINFKINLLKETKENTYIPPNTFQMLAENAIKHNKFSDEEPLNIEISEEKNVIVVKNNLNKRTLIEKSSEIGLNNIKSRYNLLVNKTVNVTEDENWFIVLLPKIGFDDYEMVIAQKI
ncbi:MAG: sensor histidine kinase [Bacteroidales bacterium]|nr:sensor histidine kinase [Bacteroidales bacterium]